MSSVPLLDRPRQWAGTYVNAWDRFWFTPRLPNTLGLLRILTGAMLLYGHLVLASELSSFLGENAWINNDTARQLHDGAFGISDMGRSYLWYINSPALLTTHHIITIVVTAAFMLGFLTRISAPAAWLLQLMYIHRLTGSLFGLDQIVTYSAMYLMLAPCGSVYSVDAWLRKKFGDKLNLRPKLRWLFPAATPSVAANIATRLFQLHLCVIYLFGGLAKARGESWWDGTAVWFAIGNLEYQSVDMTWLATYPRIFSALSHTTLFWEIFYCALVWPKVTRPLVLAIAFSVHGGIALFLGMATFGLMMIAANMIFLEPEWLRRRSATQQAGAMDATNEEEIDDDAESVANESVSGTSESAIGLSGVLAVPETYAGTTDQDVVARAQKVDAAAEVLRKKHAKLKARHTKMKDRELKYKQRVKRLKKREAKIKAFAERRRQAKANRAAKTSEADSPQE